MEPPEYLLPIFLKGSQNIITTNLVNTITISSVSCRSGFKNDFMCYVRFLPMRMSIKRDSLFNSKKIRFLMILKYYQSNLEEVLI